MPAATGSTRRSWSIPVWSPRASPTTFRRSTRRSSRSSRRACTRSSGRRRRPPRRGIAALWRLCRGSGPMITTEIRTGQMFADRYRTIRRLGSGGMATVWLAEDEKLRRKGAVKSLHADVSDDDVVRRFQREAQVGASLNHPGVVAVYDIAADDEGVLIVMEYVDGRTLRDE